MATTEAATSVVGDIVGDGADMTPGSTSSPVEQSAATGAADAALADRPHPIKRPELGDP